MASFVRRFSVLIGLHICRASEQRRHAAPRHTTLQILILITWLSLLMLLVLGSEPSFYRIACPAWDASMPGVFTQ